MATGFELIFGFNYEDVVNFDPFQTTFHSVYFGVLVTFLGTILLMFIIAYTQPACFNEPSNKVSPKITSKRGVTNENFQI